MFNNYQNKHAPRSKEKKKCIVVLGMHRSGTSAIAGTLKLLGVDLGSDLMPPSKANPKGYYENNKIFNVNKLILDALGAKWDDMFYLPDKWWKKKEIIKLHKKARKIIADDFENTGIIGIKNPRLCILMLFWLEVLIGLDIKPYFIIPVRNPLEVARSLFDCTPGFSEEKSLFLWTKYVLDSELFSRGYPRVFINFNEFIASPGIIIEKAFRSFHLLPPKNIKTHEKEITDFIEPKLRHFKYINKLTDQRVIRLIRELYSLLIRNTHIKTKTSDFDRIRFEFHRMASLFLNRDLEKEIHSLKHQTEIDAKLIKEKEEINELIEYQLQEHLFELKKIESSLIYKTCNSIAFLSAAIRDYLELILITIKDALLFNRNGLSKFPTDVGFRGYLDNPDDNGKCAICSGWFVSKKPLKRVELFIGDKKITKLERNIRRKDVDRAVRGYASIERKGFEYIVPDTILSNLNKKKHTLFIRFYIDGKHYIDKYHTKVRF